MINASKKVRPTQAAAAASQVAIPHAVKKTGQREQTVLSIA
jgi:hypothetical protein